MKQLTFNFLRRQLLLIMAVIGFSTSMLANTDVTYTEPSYTCDSGKDFDNLTLRYATEMSLTCGANSDTWTHDGTREFYNVLSDFTIDAKAGETVTANFKANNPAYESKNSEDLRWTIATLHIDWNRDGNFESSEIIAGKTGAQIGTGNDNQLYYGNREYIFDITKDIVIPEGTTPGKVRVRLNYTNAWIGDESVSAFATKSKEGIVYDFDINIVEPEKVVTYLVSWAGETVMQGGYLKVVYADSREEVKSDETEVPEGSVLEIIPLPDKGYSLSELSYQAVGGTGASINIEEKPYTFTVGGGGPDMKYIIISAEFTPDTYTLSTSVTPENSGSVSVKTTDGTTIEGNVTHGQTIVITASANDNYKLQSLDVTGATKVDGQENQYTVEGDVTVTATFVEDAPAETWTEVHFNSISGSKSNEIDLNNDPYYIYPEQTGTNNWNTTNSSGASETDNKFGPYIKTVSEGYYLAYRYEVEKKATYRFSFLHKKAGTVETTAKLCYTTDLSETFTDASDVVALEKKDGKESGVLFQSNKIELEKGSYYFVYYIVSGGESKVRIADFKLEMLDGSAVEPAMPAITIMKPVNGNLTINYLNGEVMEEISTYEFEEDSKVYNIPENTVLSITANPEVGYVLDTILPEGMVEKTGKGGDTYYEYTVTGDATIEATFIEEEIQYGKVSVVEPLEAEGTIEIQLYNVLFGSWRPAADFFLESVEYGMQLRAKVDANEGYAIESVKKNDEIITANEEDGCYYFTVDAADIKISATFTEIPETDPIIGVGTDSATAPIVSTASSPTWFVMKSSHLTVAERQNRFMYWNEENSRLECTQHNDGIKLSEISDVYRWRFEDAGDGNIYIINKATGKALSVPANASSETGNANINTPLTLEETGSKWSFALSSTVNSTQALPNQYCFDYVDYAEADRAAYLNAMDGQAAIPYGITIYEMGVQNASGWFIYEAPAIVKNYDITVKKPVNGNLVISYTVNDEMQSIETYNFENDSEVFSIEEGTVLSISVNPDFDYVLDQILPEGMEEKTGLAGDTYYEYTVTGDATIEATFKPIQYGKVSAETPEEGTIEIQLHNPMMDKWVPADEFFLEQVEFGTELRAKVEANTGYELVSVMKNQEELSTEEEGYYYFTVDAEEITISAEFEAEEYTLTTEVNPAEGGSVSVTVNGVTVEGSVKYGDVITVTVTVNEGYLLESVVVEGAEEVEGQKDQYTVTGNITITATFKKDTSSINSIENGTVYYNAEEEVLYTGTAKSVRVYDLSGRLVLNAENQENVSLAELAEGVYTAIIDGKIIKLNK